MKNKKIITLITLISILVLIVITVLVSSLFIKKDDGKKLEGKEEKIKSSILQELVKNNWSSNIDLGTKETTFDNYDIYFDEGIEVRTINQKVYNIVFTEKYKKDIVSNVKSTENINSVIEKLGEPDFGGKTIKLIGYRYDDYYIFFNGKQASVYRNEKIDNVEYDVFNKEYENVKSFVDGIKNTWNDYDLFEVEEMDGKVEYGMINYANKGIRISLQNGKIQLYTYNNCKYKIPNSDIYDIISKNKNLVYEVETERQNSIHNRQYAYDQYQSSVNNLPPDFEETNEQAEFKIVQSKKFLEIQTNYSQSGEFDLKFVSIDGEYPNTELYEKIYSVVWVDDYNIIYSIKNKGIYEYNVKDNEKIILKEGKEDFYIYGITLDNKLQYDNSEMTISL